MVVEVDTGENDGRYVRKDEGAITDQPDVQKVRG